MIRIIPYEEWCEKISPMWNVSPNSIRIVNNPFRVIRYDFLEARDKICFFPVEYSEDGVVKGYNAIYNISDTMLRFRGIYVLPKFRGNGVAHRMCFETTELFPVSFFRVIGFYKENGLSNFIKNGMRNAPVKPMWSDFSNSYLHILYRDRQELPSSDEIIQNREFLFAKHPAVGFGGTNNLDCSWDNDKWSSYAKNDFEHYTDIGLDLNWA